MPSFSLGLGLGLTQELQEGDERNENEQEKKERKDEKLDEEESYDSEETECDNNILGIEDHQEGRRDVGKRLKKPLLKVSSPYNQKEAGLWIHAHVIDAWTDVSNYEEKLKSNSTVNRINLEESTVDVIDNRNSVAKFSRAYRDAPNELKILFSRYLMSVNHKSALILEGVKPERVNINWCTRDNHVDCGVFCMRHMETYMGDKTVNWTCGLPKESKQQQTVLNDLHIKYLKKILLSDANTYRSRIIAQIAKFAKKD
ncbi:unnamed protein product [Lactuca virosa]|uniref:Ubiquitin-like protease family profile domain-containing protein n=1 Tax=Lactuca virosa TaxID=75947 RepID=A0AAU9LNF8_9ASTR|nr:unnamed protein product [Lactuca virosa]